MGPWATTLGQPAANKLLCKCVRRKLMAIMTSLERGPNGRSDRRRRRTAIGDLETAENQQDFTFCGIDRVATGA